MQQAGDLADLPRQLFGDLRRGVLRLEIVGIVEQRAQHPPVFRLVDLGVGEFVRLLNRAVEIRADDVAVEIADDQQRRIQQRFAVAQQLPVGLIEILFLALVFPGETTLAPHVGKAPFLIGRLRTGVVNDDQLKVFDHALLKTKPVVAGGIGFDGRFLAEESAKVVEMLLIGGGFLALVFRPLFLEFGWGHWVQKRREKNKRGSGVQCRR